MSNVDAMRRLKEDIIASYDARVATVEEIVNNTQETLGRFHQEHQERKSEVETTLSQFHQEHQEMSDALRATLSEAESSRLENFRALLNDIQSKRKEREEQVAALLNALHNEHQEMANTLREALAQAETARLDATLQRQNARTNEVTSLLNSYKEEREGMAAAWRELSEIMQQRRAKVPPEEVPVEVTPEVEEEVPVEEAPPVEVEVPPVEEEVVPVVEEEAPQAEEEVVPTEEYREALQNRMLSIINSHPDGIRLVDIGEELSVAWRSLIPLARNLVDSGQVTKVDVLYYPAGATPQVVEEEPEAEEAEESEEE